MAHDHIGIPKFIEKGFSYNNQVYVSDVLRDKRYVMSVDRLGTENNYYDEDVEKQILASGIESSFSQFYNDFCGTRDIKFMKQILDLNTALIEEFFSFMFMRAKKTLEQVNRESITSQVFGNIDHSELLRIQLLIQTNPLQIIGKKFSFYPLVNLSKTLFIDNSIGFGLMKNKKEEYSFIIPLNTRVAILISRNMEQIDNGFFIESNGDYKVDRINKRIIDMEKALGNGFFFGYEKSSIENYTSYYKSIKAE